MKDSLIDQRAYLKSLWVSLFCLAGAAVGSFYLYTDLNESGKLGQGKPIALIEKRESQVKRKASNSFAWTQVQPNEELFKKDSIQTGRGSAVTVRLSDGTQLDIGENSLVVMDEVENLSLGFLRGSFVVHKADGDSQISVGKDGKAKVERLSIRLIQPESLARFFVSRNEKKPVQLRWEPRTPSPHPFLVQISTDRRFVSGFNRSLLTPNPSTLTLQEALGPGRYFWRVAIQGKPVTEIREFRVLLATPLQPIWPGQADKVSSPPGENQIQFRWIIPKQATQEEADVLEGEHRIEVSQDQNFRSFVLQETIHPVTGAVVGKNFPDGILFWRIRSQYGSFTHWSAVKSFEYKKTLRAPAEAPKKDPPLPLPVLVRPDPGARFQLLGSKVPIEASWSEVEGAKFYELTIYQLSKDSDQKKQILRTQTEKTTLSLTTLGEGEYLWTLRAVDQKMQPGVELPLRKFILKYPDPLAPPQVLSPEVQ